MTSLIPRGRAIADLFRILEGSLPFTGQRAVKVEEYQEDGQYVLRAEIPGVDPARDITVTVDGELLTITAERSVEKPDKSHSEFRYGSFTRVTRLPVGTDASTITATYESGILEVRVPVAEAVPPRRVSVEVGKS